MIVTVAVTLCHLVSVDPDKTPVLSCFEEVVATRSDFGPATCAFIQPQLADWKRRGKYGDDTEWALTGWKCVPGDYHPRGKV